MTPSTPGPLEHIPSKPEEQEQQVTPWLQRMSDAHCETGWSGPGNQAEKPMAVEVLHSHSLPQTSNGETFRAQGRDCSPPST